MVIPKNLSCSVKYRYILYSVKFLHLKFSTSLPNDNNKKKFVGIFCTIFNCHISLIKRFTPYLYTLLVKPDLQIKLLLTRAKYRHLALSSLIRRFSEGVSKLLSWRRKIFKFVTFRKYFSSA